MTLRLVFLAAACALVVSLAARPSMATEASVESSTGLRQVGFGARAFLYKSRRGPAFGGGLDFVGLLRDWYGFGAQVFVAHTPDECACIRSQLQATPFAEVRAFPGFVLTPYGRAGLALAAIKWAHFADSSAEDFTLEKKGYLGAHLEGGLDVHHLSISLRIFGFVDAYPGLDLQVFFPAAGAQIGGFIDTVD